MICKSVTTSDGTINSNDIREAVHEALQDGRLKDGAVKAGNDAVRSWLRTKGTRNCADWDIDSDSRLSSYNSDTSTTSSSSEDRYSDDDEEMENISSSDPEIFSDGETLSDTSSADSVFSSALSWLKYGASQQDLAKKLSAPQYSRSCFWWTGATLML